MSEKMSVKMSVKMTVKLLIKCRGGWLAAALLDEPELYRAMNAAAVLKAAVLKCGELDFAEGAAVRLLVNGKELFGGRVFTKRRTRPEVIEIVAYDEMRYLQNRDCCVFAGVEPGAMLKQMAAALGLEVGDVAQTGWLLRARAYDNRRYIDMMQAALDEVLAEKNKHFVVLAEGGKLCLRDCRAMQLDLCLELASFGGYEYRTTIDEGYANRVKLIYEDKRKAARRQFVAEDAAAIQQVGVLQYVHKSAAADEETAAKAKAKLQQIKRRGDSLLVSGAPGDVAVRGGSLVWVRLDLGDKIVDSQALVKSARHSFVSGVCVMDLELDCGLFAD